MKDNNNLPVWDLSIFYSDIDSEKILEDARKALQLSEQFHHKYKNIFINDEITDISLAKMLSIQEEISELIAKANSYAFLLYSENSQNIKALKLLGNLEEITTQLSNNMLFFTLSFNKLDDNKLKNLLESPLLKEYRYYLSKIIDEKKYQLTEKEEKIVNIKDITGVNAFKKLYNNITTEFKFKINVNGEEKVLTENEIIKLRLDSNWDLRRESSKVQFGKYKKEGKILNEIYNNIVKDITTENSLRGFKSNLSAENFSNGLSDQAIENLIKVTDQNNDIVKEFFKIKAKFLEVEKLRLCDTQVSVAKDNKKYTFKEAKDIILESFSEFDDRFYNIAKRIFDENRIHARIMDNKMEGAFCYFSSPKIPPYVLINYSGYRDDIITLAHELGHAIHGVLSSKQNIFNYWSNLPFAEIASVFAEILVTEKLLRISSSKEERLTILFEKMNDIVGTTFRQNMFTNFEIQAHKLIDSGFVSLDEFSNLYFDILKKTYDNSVDYPEEYHYEWLSVPHIFETPFYCYSYNFAQLLVFGLYEKYLDEGKRFINNYIKLLESGGNEKPEKLAKIVSININDTKIWEKGFELMRKKFLTNLKDLF